MSYLKKARYQKKTASKNNNTGIMTKLILTFFLSAVLASPAIAENYLTNGEQESQISFQMVQKIAPIPSAQKLMLSFIVPVSFSSPTYSQKITKVDFSFKPTPWKQVDKNDHRGNKVVEVTWQSPTTSITTAVRFTAVTSVKLQKLMTNTPFPIPELPKTATVYLKATKQVAATDENIRAKANQLTHSSETEFDAVQQILTWLVDHMHYILNPPSFEALYAFRSGKGNCQNYSHLAAALMRAVGIPVRIVNGIALKEPYDIGVGNTLLTLKMAQGRHSWIEVYFPDLGWVPFDPAGTELFVSNRLIRAEIGLDNNETRQDGLIRWTNKPGTSAIPQFKESIDAVFVADRINLSAQKTNYGPRKLLLSPRVETVFSKVSLAPPLPIPQQLPENVLKRLGYTEPYVFGNLEFPQNVDFLAARGAAQQNAAGTMEMRKNFLVETAEYVTTQGKQYAQTFILTKPLQLEKIGLALHKFGGQGQIWLELFKDNGGKPGTYIGTSDIIDLSQLGYTPGYTWVDFAFNKTSNTLSPGRYWMAFGFTGSPVINWFFSYGKPIGPQDGTRYKTLFDEDWSRSLSYEFNYRVVGLSPK
ncbi:transglutaminase domain-containing protein [Thermodesulfobacteriota bacterium]